jgi:hypothetical protein
MKITPRQANYLRYLLGLEERQAGGSQRTLTACIAKQWVTREGYGPYTVTAEGRKALGI